MFQLSKKLFQKKLCKIFFLAILFVCVTHVDSVRSNAEVSLPQAVKALELQIPQKEESQKEKDLVVTDQSKYRITWTFDKLSEMRDALEQILHKDKSLKPESKNRILCGLKKVGSVISSCVSFARSGIQMTVQTAQSIFTVKEAVRILVLVAIIDCMFGQTVFNDCIVPVSEKFASYLAYLIGNMSKSVVTGLSAPLQDCLNSEECTTQMHELIANTTKLVTQAGLEGSGAAAEGAASAAYNWSWDNPGKALIATGVAAGYGALNLLKSLVPVFKVFK